MKLAIGIVCWIETNEQLPELKRCLDSVKDYEVFVVNGKWADMPGDNQNSTKEAIELINSYDNVTHIQHDGFTEVEARNVYLNLAYVLKYDYVLMLDTDEWLENIADVKPNWPIHNVKGYSSGHGGDIVALKLIDPVVRHRYRHNRYFIGDDEITKIGDTLDIFIRHEKDYRPESVKKHMEEMRRIRPEN